jgi:hypothetical protein
MNSPYCSPCSLIVGTASFVITQEEEDDDDDDGNEVDKEDKENDDGPTTGVQVSTLKPAVRKLLADDGQGGRAYFVNGTVADPLGNPKRRLFLTPKEKVSRKRKAADPTPVAIVSPTEDEPTLKWTSIVGSNRLKIDDSMLLLKMNTLISFIDDNFVCKHCLKSDSVVERKTIGFATTFTHRCSCGKTARIKPDVTSINDDITAEQFNDKSYDKPLKCESYDINQRLILALQQMGGGPTEAALLGGMLNIGTNTLRDQFHRIELEISKVEKTFGDETIDQNREEEMRLTNESIANGDVKKQWQADGTMDASGKAGITVSGDARWDKRACGRIYNSDSGAQLICGTLSNKCVAVEVMSKRCAACECERLHDKETECSKNYDGSSKGMEGVGAHRNVKKIFDNCNCYIRYYVMDDDGSTKRVLKWKLSEFKKAVAEGRITDAGEEYTAKNGMLDINHPFITFLADKNHRVRTYASAIFKLAYDSKANSLCTKVDAERLKRNFGYCLHLYHDRPFEEFKKSVECVVEHHFNNHDNCGDWCCAKKWEGQEKIAKELKYRDKIKDAKLYSQIRTIHDKFCTDDWLKDLWHDVHSNKCESLNGFLTKFLPKKKYFCRSMAISGRTHLAITIDSIGYEKTYSELFNRLGLKYTSVTRKHHQQLNAAREYHAKRGKLIHVKKRRSKMKNEKLKSGKEKLAKDRANDLYYETGMAGPLAFMGLEPPPPKRVIKKKDPCEYCGLTGHTTRRAKACLFSTKKDSIHYREENNRKEKIAKPDTRMVGAPKVITEEDEQGESEIGTEQYILLYVLKCTYV